MEFSQKSHSTKKRHIRTATERQHKRSSFSLVSPFTTGKGNASIAYASHRPSHNNTVHNAPSDFGMFITVTPLVAPMEIEMGQLSSLKSSPISVPLGPTTFQVPRMPSELKSLGVSMALDALYRSSNSFAGNSPKKCSPSNSMNHGSVLIVVV